MAKAKKVVALRHSVRKGNWRMYFYDGELPVVDSVLTVPANRPEWIQRAWIQGFRSTVDGRVIADLAKHIRAELADDEPAKKSKKDETPAPAEETENATSDEETNDEGTDSGGQPAADDGVRAGEPEGDEGVPAAGVDGSDRDEPADGGSADEPAD